MSIDWTIQWTLTNNTGSTLTGRRDYKDRMSEAEGSGPFTVPCTAASGLGSVACTLPSDDDYCPAVAPHSARSIAWKYSIAVDDAASLKTQMVRGYVEFSDTGGASANNIQVRWWFDTAHKRLTFEVAPDKDNPSWTCGVLRAGISVTVNDVAHPAAAAPNSDVNVDHQNGPADLRHLLHSVAEEEAATWAPLVKTARDLDAAHKTWSPANRDAQDDVGKNVDARDALILKYFEVLKAAAAMNDLQTKHPVDTDPSPGRDWCGVFAYWCWKQIKAQQWNLGTGFPEPAGIDINIQTNNGKAGGYSGYEILRPGDILYFSTPSNNNHFVIVTRNWGDGLVDYVQGNATKPLVAGTRVPLTFTGLNKAEHETPRSHTAAGVSRPLQIVRCAVPAPECVSAKKCLLGAQPACPSGYGPEVFNHVVVVTLS